MSMFYDFGGGVANVNLDKWLAPKYDENLTWKPGDYCVYLGVLKKCTATTTGPFVEASWKDAFLINDGGGGGGSDSFDFIAKEYDPDETYNTGDVVLYNDETHECTADGTTGAWDSSKWKRVYLADLNSNASGIDVILNSFKTPSSLTNISVDVGFKPDEVIIMNRYASSGTMILRRTSDNLYQLDVNNVWNIHTVYSSKVSLSDVGFNFTPFDTTNWTGRDLMYIAYKNYK